MTLKQTLSMDSIKNTKILVGITSTPTSWLELTSIQRHHPLSRYFISRVELAPLSETELQDTILKSLAGTGVSFNPDVIAKVYKYTKGHPFEMQVLCSHLFNNQVSQRVDVAMWDKSLQTTLNDMGVAIFDYWYSLASEEEAKVLRVIAEVETSVSTKQIHDLAVGGTVKVSPPNIAKYLQRLVEKKLINKSGRGSYSIQDRMFRAYVCTRPD